MGLLFENYDKTQQLEEKKYSIGLDLSTVSTGMCLYNIEKDEIEEVEAVRYDKENKIFVQAEIIASKIQEWENKYGLDSTNCIYAKEKQPIQYGRMTTITTIVSIAKLHGLVEKFFYEKEIPLLDTAVSTIRKIVVGNYKADKEEVFNFICKKYELKEFEDKGGHDIADAVAVCLSSKESLKGEYLEKIKELKREKKKFKLASKLKSIDEQILKYKGKAE